MVAIGQRPRVTDILITSNLNTDMADPDRQERDETTAEAMLMEGFEYMVIQFLPCHQI